MHSPKYYRCGKCRSRRRLNKEVWEYKIASKIPKCSCGVTDWRLDNHRRKEQRKKVGAYEVCYCSGLHYPHKIASSVWCEHHPTGPSDADYEELYSR